MELLRERMDRPKGGPHDVQQDLSNVANLAQIPDDRPLMNRLLRKDERRGRHRTCQPFLPNDTILPYVASFFRRKLQRSTRWHSVVDVRRVGASLRYVDKCENVMNRHFPRVRQCFISEKHGRRDWWRRETCFILNLETQP